MFDDQTALSVDGPHAVLLHPEGKQPVRFERDMVQLSLFAASIQVETELHCEYGWSDPAVKDAPLVTGFAQADFLKVVPRPSVQLAKASERVRAWSSAQLVNSRIFAFNDGPDWAEIDKVEVQIVAGDKHLCQTIVVDDILSVSLVLDEERFARLLKHVYLSSARFELNLTLGAIGYQRPWENAHATGPSASHLFFEAERVTPSEIRSIAVRRAVQDKL